jgi:hypothetical protein
MGRSGTLGNRFRPRVLTHFKANQWTSNNNFTQQQYGQDRWDPTRPPPANELKRRSTCILPAVKEAPHSRVERRGDVLISGGSNLDGEHKSVVVPFFEGVQRSWDPWGMACTC